MTTIPKVSVIIPCYNCADFIEIAINSVLQQTEQKFEILIGDDCSTDASVQIITEISNRDKRVKLFVNTKNSGPSATRNRLIDEAKGEWISLLDADDFYHPERLQKLITIAETEQMDLLADNLINVDMQGKKIAYALPLKIDNELIHVTAEVMIKKDLPGSLGFKYGVLKPIMKRQFLNGNKIRYREKINVGEDFFLYLECLIKSARFLLTLEPLYNYRIREDSLTRSPDALSTKRLLNNNNLLMELALNFNQSVIYNLMEKRGRLYTYSIKYGDFIVFIRNGRIYDAVMSLLVLPFSGWLFFAKLMYNRLIINLIK